MSQTDCGASPGAHLLCRAVGCLAAGIGVVRATPGLVGMSLVASVVIRSHLGMLVWPRVLRRHYLLGVQVHRT